ncbi:MAG: hypothetical protein KF690_05485, partial [Bacteroidetes bacterium]|nr:hypothetical protein [Bacteroidota bacterium]
MPRAATALLHMFLFSCLLPAWITWGGGTVGYAQGTVPAQPDSAGVLVDFTQSVVDSLRKKARFESPVAYEAQDSVIFELKQETLLLYTQGKIQYQRMNLTADRIRMDMQAHTMEARGVADSLGQLSGTPAFEDNGQSYTAEQIRYNYDTGKGRVIYARTQMQEQQVIGPVSRRNPDN